MKINNKSLLLKMMMCFTLCISLSVLQAQLLPIEQYKILEGEKNGVNTTEYLQTVDPYSMLYYLKEDTSTVYFMNYFRKDETFSTGPIYNLQIDDYYQKEDDLPGRILTFLWDYENSYNDKTGTASVQIYKVEELHQTSALIKIELLDEPSENLILYFGIKL